MDGEQVIMESYSECHWPGGQLRVSNFECKGWKSFPPPKG
jgi:hypothetical protein